MNTRAPEFSALMIIFGSAGPRTYCVTLARKLEQQPDLVGVINRGGRPKGTGRHLTPKQGERALRWLCGSCPDQLRLPFALWTRRAVQELFRARFEVARPIRTVGLYLERWGMTPQRPTRRAFERDDAAVDRWLRVEYPKIARKAMEERAEISWGDETGLRSDETRHRGYALRGKTPVLRIPVRRTSLSVISAITKNLLEATDLVHSAKHVGSQYLPKSVTQHRLLPTGEEQRLS